MERILSDFEDRLAQARLLATEESHDSLALDAAKRHAGTNCKSR